MNNIEKIRQEIERRKKSLRAGICNDEAFTRKQKEEMLVASGELTRLSRFLDSLPGEKPSEDLNDEIKKFIEEYGYERGEDKLLIAIVARHFIDWQYQKDRREFAKLKAKEWSDGYDEGIVKGKQQMMKEAVEAKIYGYDDGSFELIASWLDIPNNSIYKDGDKVKIIIVKED